MPYKKKRVPWILLGILLVVSGYFGYLFNGAYARSGGVSGITNAFQEVVREPFGNYYDGNTVSMILFWMTVYVIAVAMYYTSRKNFMPGKEYGSAKLADPAEISKQLEDEDPANNRILSRNVKMSLNTRKTKRNNNVLIIGGSGAGKTFFEVKPNMMQLPKSSFIVTDPKGEIVRSLGGMLKDNGYNVKVLNLMEMDKSDRYNPFAYIRDETDIVKLVTNIISNTTPKDSKSSDPFWDKSEGLFLQSLFLYVWLEEPVEKRNFASVMKLLGEAEATEGKKVSKLTQRMNRLEERSPQGSNHPAVKQYRKCMRGAGDTVRSIIISANSRLAYLENSKVLSMLSQDDMHLEEIGIGVNGDKRTKTALFCVIPDSDKSYNFIVGMLYTQIFQELYYQADFNYGGRLPIHVTFMLDEFANVALPDDFCSLLSTMRSREISSVIIIQNLAQIKALFKDTWETIPGNCDSLVYLGGNEQSTHKYISELIGKSTIDKRSNSETRSRQGSSSKSFDVIGRELLTADETRKLDNRYCILFIRGYDPVIDTKYQTQQDPRFRQTADGEGEAYVHVPICKRKTKPVLELLGKDSLEYYGRLAKEGNGNIHIDTLTVEELMDMEDGDGFSHEQETSGQSGDYPLADNECNPENVYELENMPEAGSPEETSESGDSAGQSGGEVRVKKADSLDKLMNLIMQNKYTKEQEQELRNALKEQLSYEEIESFYRPETSVQKMREYIETHRRTK